MPTEKRIFKKRDAKAVSVNAWRHDGLKLLDISRLVSAVRYT
jgi:hypothetical protein